MAFFSVPIQKHVTFNPAGSYVVDGLKPDTLYRFSLAARSEMGLGVYTQPVEARTAQSSESMIFLPSVVFSPRFPLTGDSNDSRQQSGQTGLSLGRKKLFHRA